MPLRGSYRIKTPKGIPDAVWVTEDGVGFRSDCGSEEHRALRRYTAGVRSGHRAELFNLANLAPGKAMASTTSSPVGANIAFASCWRWRSSSESISAHTRAVVGQETRLAISTSVRVRFHTNITKHPFLPGPPLI